MTVKFENFGDEAGWIAYFDTFQNPELKGTIASGKTKAEAWKELMISLQVKIAYDSGLRKDEIEILTQTERKKEYDGKKYTDKDLETCWNVARYGKRDDTKITYIHLFEDYLNSLNK